MASDPANPKVLANLRTQAEAQLLVNQLESIGIKAARFRLWSVIGVAGSSRRGASRGSTG